MKIIKIEVKSCEGCKHYRRYKDGLFWHKYYCHQTGKRIPDINTIPDWCELEDAPEEIEKWYLYVIIANILL